MKKSTNEYNVTALRKSIAVMEVVKNSHENLGVSEIARQAGVSKNMCLRILETLSDIGWVEQHPQGPVYEMTLAPFKFFAHSRNRITLMDQAYGPLKRLNRETGESVYLAVPYQDQAMILHVIKGSKPISVTGEIGSSYDLHATAPGKIFLAWADKEYIGRYLKRKLASHTDRTLTDTPEIKAELGRIRKQGYATNKEEYGSGLLGLAAPIFNEDHDVIASIGVFMPSTNIAPDQLEPTFAGPVCEAATAASQG